MAEYMAYQESPTLYVATKENSVKTSQGKLSKLQEITIKRINEAGGMAFKVTSLDEVKGILKGVMLEK